MKTMKGNETRLLVLFALMALLPLAIWACGDAGHGPGLPTGPSTKYNPQMDQAGASLTAFASNPNPAPGGTFKIGATFKDAFGKPVEGAPIHAWPEFGNGFSPNFGFVTNPTLTDANGQASIMVIVPADCPNDSYTFVVSTHPAVEGPYARAFVHIAVTGAGAAAITDVTVVAGPHAVIQGGSGQYIASVTATVACTPTVQFSFEGGAFSATSTHTWSNVGTFFVVARATCDGSNFVLSEPYEVVVTAAAP